ncbi:MAG TPA: 50S ribosomal L9 C-terminal domain-containing protein, partial [Methylocella sp.]|nr:50S ribosomal L9 C-terminal domain-containing protein [Methylocella sp.]
TPRDIAAAVSEGGFSVNRNQIVLKSPIKSLGLHEVPVHLHPEIEVIISINIARSAEEAERQAKGETIAAPEKVTVEELGLEVGAALAEAAGSLEEA